MAMYDYIAGHEAARLLGVSRKTAYRWAHEGRISMPFSRSDILGRQPAKRARGPQANPNSKRYHEGRHTFRPRSEKASD